MLNNFYLSLVMCFVVNSTVVKCIQSSTKLRCFKLFVLYINTVTVHTRELNFGLNIILHYVFGTVFCYKIIVLMNSILQTNIYFYGWFYINSVLNISLHCRYYFFFKKRIVYGFYNHC